MNKTSMATLKAIRIPGLFFDEMDKDLMARSILVEIKGWLGRDEFDKIYGVVKSLGGWYINRKFEIPVESLFDPGRLQLLLDALRGWMSGEDIEYLRWQVESARSAYNTAMAIARRLLGDLAVDVCFSLAEKRLAIKLTDEICADKEKWYSLAESLTNRPWRIPAPDWAIRGCDFYKPAKGCFIVTGLTTEEFEELKNSYKYSSTLTQA